MARYITIGLIALFTVAGLMLMNRVYYDPERDQASSLYQAYLSCLGHSVSKNAAEPAKRAKLAETALADCSDQSLAYTGALRTMGHSPSDVANIEKTFAASARWAVERNASGSIPH